MDKSEIRTGRNDGSGHKSKGLVNLGTKDLCCLNCNTHLLRLQLTGVAKGGVITRILAKCGLCGGHSKVETAVGSFYPGAANDTLSFDTTDLTHDDPEADVGFLVWLKKR